MQNKAVGGRIIPMHGAMIDSPGSKCAVAMPEARLAGVFDDGRWDLMTRPFDDELHWKAFHYATGELPEADEQQFEQQLECDHAAREALADAVAMMHSIRAAEALPVVIAAADSSRTATPATLVAERRFTWQHAATWA